MQQVEIITIDGPVASGKGSVSSGVAQILGFHVLDSGSLYRLTAFKCLEKGVDVTDPVQTEAVARGLEPNFLKGHIFLDGEDVTDSIRTEEVGLTASKVATIPGVRKALFDLQRNFARPPGLVADGRDMGSVVFPEARLKVFLVASAEARAKRRYNQLKEKGISSNIANLVRDLKERDERDMQRAVAPLVPPKGARILDSSDLTLEQTINQVLEWYRENRA